MEKEAEKWNCTYCVTFWRLQRNKERRTGGAMEKFWMVDWTELNEKYGLIGADFFPVPN